LTSSDHMRIVTSDLQNVVVNGRLGRPAEVQKVDGTWAYLFDLFPPRERTWLLRQDELEGVDD
jgi:hypothetical protein